MCVSSYTSFYSYFYQLLECCRLLNGYFSSCDNRLNLWRCKGRRGKWGWRWGGLEAEDGLKQQFSITVPLLYVTINDRSRVVQDCCYRSCLVPPVVLLMLLRAEKCIFIVQQHWKQVLMFYHLKTRRCVNTVHL